MENYENNTSSKSNIYASWLYLQKVSIWSTYLVSTSLEVTSIPNPKNRIVSNNSTPHLVGIIVSLVVIVILVIVVALLVYKIKMYKLKQKYETR